MNKNRKILVSVIAVLISCIILLGVLLFAFVVPEMKYNDAMEFLESGNIEEAYSTFLELKSYKDSEKQLESFQWVISKRTSPYLMEEFNYNEYAECMIEKRTTYDNYSYGGGSVSGYHYRYDEKGNCVEKIPFQDYDEYDSTKNYEYQYDEHDKCIKKTEKADGFIESVTEYIYDAKGNCVTETIDHMSSTKTVMTYRYDKKGNLIEAVNTSVGDGFTEMMNRQVYEYDEAGNCIKETFYPYRSMVTEEHTFNQDGKRIKTIGRYNGTAQHREEYEIMYHYDENGNCIREIKDVESWDGTIYGGKNTETTEYEYELIYVKQRNADSN